MEDNQYDPAYRKGYNEGYAFAKHLPELAEKLSKVEIKTPRGVGFKDGRQQFIAEAQKEKFPSWLKGNRTNDRTKQSKHRDRDIEPEI